MTFRAFMLLLAAAAMLPACAPSLADDVDLANVAPDDIVFVGDSAIYPNATIAENVAAAPAFSRLAILLERTDLPATLGGDGPLTIFAPTDAALTTLPPHTDEALRRTLASHVIAERITAAQLASRIAQGGGSYRAQTLAGDMLTFRIDGETVVLSGSDGTSARVTMADLAQANGVMHVIDGMLLPES